jgi:hypothetical protein
MLAVTSDKSTLHIFDLPNPIASGKNTLSSGASVSSLSSLTAGSSTTQKWGILGKIPLMPRVFSDVYSFASAHFEIGDEPSGAGQLVNGATVSAATGAFGGRPPKGLIGWTSDSTLVVVGAGVDGRWEKFALLTYEDGKRECVREGWRRYLGEG